MTGFGDLSQVARLSTARTRSICPENPSGGPGQGGRATEGTGAHAARDLGRGWKISPSVVVEANQSLELAQIEGPGVIQHLWLTGKALSRDVILRVYWDHQSQPSIEVPLGDFFGVGWGPFAQLSSMPIVVNPN